MSSRIEWSTVTADIWYSPEPGAFVDQYGTQSDGPAIGIFTGSDGAVIEADSPEAMIGLLERLIREIRRHEEPTGYRYQPSDADDEPT